MKRIIILLLLTIPIYAQAVETGNTLDTNVVKDLGADWMVYNSAFKAFVPLLKEKFEETSAHQWVNLERYKEYHLNFKASPGLLFLVNQKVIYQNDTKSIQNVRIKIAEIDVRSKLSSDLLTFYNFSGDLPINDLYIGHSLKTQSFVQAVGIKLLARNTTYAYELVVILFLFVLVLFTMLKNLFPKAFDEFFNLNKLLPNTLFDQSYYTHPLSTPSIFLIIFNSLSITLLLVVIDEKIGFLKFIPILQSLNLKTIEGIFLFTLFVIIIYLLKYVYLSIVGWIFNLPNLVKIQYLELLKIFSKVNFITVPIVIILTFSGYFDFDFDYNNFYFIVFFCLFIVIFRISFLIFRLTSFRYLYLFSYLCTTEILPLAIIIKIILF